MVEGDRAVLRDHRVGNPVFVPKTGERPTILSRLMERDRLVNVASRH
ncbi:hypothetical protein [Pararhizobium sp. A13]